MPSLPLASCTSPTTPPHSIRFVLPPCCTYHPPCPLPFSISSVRTHRPLFSTVSPNPLSIIRGGRMQEGSLNSCRFSLSQSHLLPRRHSVGVPFTTVPFVCTPVNSWMLASRGCSSVRRITNKTTKRNENGKNIF
ncbi:hypothetical protein CDAR_35371 [Caerostris darwini]|uniref:Uncharacterized protein n=1 Tax=Caerostris darwini TaxID=1538125 RepID=A0AAV4SIY9_9ARAC|nr:hypothetical protein CDAR_35371 [Caerostris darwini]